MIFDLLSILCIIDIQQNILKMEKKFIATMAIIITFVFTFFIGSCSKEKVNNLEKMKKKTQIQPGIYDSGTGSYFLIDTLNSSGYQLKDFEKNTKKNYTVYSVANDMVTVENVNYFRNEILTSDDYVSLRAHVKDYYSGETITLMDNKIKINDKIFIINFKRDKYLPYKMVPEDTSTSSGNKFFFYKKEFMNSNCSQEQNYLKIQSTFVIK